MKRFLLIIAIGLIVFVLYVLHNSRCSYYTYTSEELTEDNSDVFYEAFKDGYIKYSRTGIEYQKKFGTAEWNESITLQKPIFSVSENYVLITDMGSDKISVYNETGKVNEIKLRNAVLQANISDQGVCQVVVEAGEANLVQVYDKNGELIVDAKNSINEMGYPVTAAISPDGTKLAISCYAVKAMKTETTVAIYDLSESKKEDSNALVGTKTYSEEIIPRLYFFDDDNLVSCGEHSLHFYKIGSKIKESENVTLKNDIQSVFVGENIFGIVCDNTENPEDGKYKVSIYTKSGHQKMERVLDMSYEHIDIREEQIFAIYKNECTIMDTKGRVLFQGELDGGGIATILPADGWKKYHVVFNDRIVKMKLQFWKHK